MLHALRDILVRSVMQRDRPDKGARHVEGEERRRGGWRDKEGEDVADKKRKRQRGEGGRTEEIMP